MKNKKQIKRGDIFHDGIFGYWVIHERPKGTELFVVPLDKLGKRKKKGDCDFYHKLDDWDFNKVKVVCNLYKDRMKAKKLVGKDNYFEEFFMDIYKGTSRPVNVQLLGKDKCGGIFLIDAQMEARDVRDNLFSIPKDEKVIDMTLLKKNLSEIKKLLKTKRLIKVSK